MAHEANDAQRLNDEHAVDDASLRRAFEHCRALTAANSRTFYLASALLPAEKSRAARALYAFCRRTDDIVDQSQQGAAAAALDAWRATLTTQRPHDDPVVLAWQETRRRYAIPWLYAEQLISGVARDLRQTRYATFDDVAAYSYGVASTVGLMTMHIVGYSDAHAIPSAIKLGVALQYTNILRDVGEDWALGRVYIPQEEMAAFGVSEDVIAAGRVSQEWKRLMAHEIERTRQLYDEARPGIGLLDADGRFAIMAAADLYRGILDRIEANGYDNVTRRARLSGFEKVRRLPAIWLHSRRV